jgi:hypothetical protein
MEFNTFVSLAHAKINLTPCRRTFLTYLETIFRRNFLSNLKKFVDKEQEYDKLEIPIITKDFNFESTKPAVNLLSYYNISMLEYISKVSSPILLLANEKLKTLNDDLNEFVFIYSNLFWLLCMQVEGIDILCSNLKNSKGCKVNCDNIFKPSNIIRLYIVPEYITNSCVSDKIISTFDLLKKNKAILVIDYTNICNNNVVYKWEEVGAYDRYELAVKVLPCYFYNCKCVDFGKYKGKLDKFILKSLKDYKKLVKSWTKENKLIFF